MPNAVIFDVDGTLLDTEVLYVRAWKQAGAEFGYPMSDDLMRRTRAVTSAVAKVEFEKDFGPDFPLSTVRDRRVALAEAMIAASGDLCKPRARELLDWLRDRAIPVALATSTNWEKTRSHLEHAGLWGRFDAVVCGDMVARGKPEPDIFLEAARRLGVAPADCLVVGDTPADVQAASAGRIPVLLIPDLVPANAETTALSLAVLDSLEQVKNYLI